MIQVIGIPMGSDPAPFFAKEFLYPFFDIYIYIENGEFHTKLFDKGDNFEIASVW